MIRIFSLLFLITACSSIKETPYQKEKNNEGYSDSNLKNLDTAIFKSNSQSKKNITQAYSEFRAIERCRGMNQHANMLDQHDKSVSKDIRKSTSSSFGPSGFGMYPQYSRYSTIGFGVGYNTIDTNSWNETYLYPVIEVVYTCQNKVFRPGIVFRELNPDQMRDLVKDVRGGIQVEEISPEGGNNKILRVGDIITKASGIRIEYSFQLNALFKENQRSLIVEFFRDGEKLTRKIFSKDITDEIIKREDEIIREVCSSKGKPKENALCL